MDPKIIMVNSRAKDLSDYWGQLDYSWWKRTRNGTLVVSRFWNMFLKDRGYINQDEPFQKLINQGMILGMSAFVFFYRAFYTFTLKFFKKIDNELKYFGYYENDQGFALLIIFYLSFGQLKDILTDDRASNF